MILASLSPRIPTGTELAAILVVVSFSAGLNVYATVGMLGLLARFNVLALPTALHLLQDWKIIAVCAVLFVLEFVGDKIPVFDLLWNAAHTFVRVPVAAYLAYAATSQLPQWEQIAATFAGGLIALAAHGGKTAARAAIIHSPEPFSNFALSTAEDALVVVLMWIVTRHPYVASAIVLAALCAIAILIRFVLCALRTLLSDAEATLSGTSSGNSLH
ncbi:MAG: DUF4126 domain-containing protein [Candidatus Acidiferrales bacterium]